MKYKIETPNQLYNGVTEGVPFASGVGHTDDENVKNILINDYGYKLVEDKKAEDKPAVKEAPAKKASK